MENPLTDQLPELDPEVYEMDSEDHELPVVSPEDVPDTNPGEDVDEQDDFDDSELEGMGAADSQIWERAVPRARDKVRSHASNQVGYCLREQRIINETEALALDAAESLALAPTKHRIGDFEKVPRGVLIYFTRPGSHGHIMESLGNGYCATTDLPTGHWGRIKTVDLFRQWGYDAAWWSVYVNKNQVRSFEKPEPAPKPKPDHDDYPVIQEALELLMRSRNHHRQAKHPMIAAHLTRAIRELTDIPGL